MHIETQCHNVIIVVSHSLLVSEHRGQWGLLIVDTERWVTVDTAAAWLRAVYYTAAWDKQVHAPTHFTDTLLLLHTSSLISFSIFQLKVLVFWSTENPLLCCLVCLDVWTGKCCLTCFLDQLKKLIERVCQLGEVRLCKGKNVQMKNWNTKKKIQNFCSLLHYSVCYKQILANTHNS